jgi:hypothetical protein
MKAAWIVAPACFALVACVSSGPESQLGRKDDKPKRIEMTRTSDCVFQRNIDGFDALDDNYVVLYAQGRRKAYLADITGGCFDVKSQSQLAAVDGDRNGQICGFGRDSIAYRRLGMVEDCRIIGLQELSDERRIELGLGVPPRPEKAPGKKKAEEEKAEDQPGDGAGG